MWGGAGGLFGPPVLSCALSGADNGGVYPAINTWTFPSDAPPDEQLAAAAAASFAGIELVVAEAGPLTPLTPPGQFAELAARAAELNLNIVSLATALFWDFNYASAEEDNRQRAVDLTLRLLDQAAAAGAGAVLVVPGVVGRHDDPRPQVAYADALQRTLDALLALRHEAEARGVTIALENVWSRFLTSPVEFADLLDRVNSPQVGAYLDVGNVLAYGYPQDWIETLGGHIARVHAKDYDLARPGRDGFCPLGEGSVVWPEVLAALRAVGYGGPLTYEGPGDPRDICYRLSAIIAGRPPGPEDLT